MSPPKPRSKWRRRVGLFLLAVAVLLGLDWSRAPQKQWTTRALVATIDLYHATLSPLLPAAGVQCRFTPPCSHYAEGALRRHGALVGGGKTAWRIVRCGPWTEAGTVDPP